jgi:hypothetical protein
MRSFAALLTLVMVILVGALARGQGQDVEAPMPGSVGFPWDWSHQHVVFTKTTDPEVLEKTTQDPRAFHQWLRRTRDFSLPAEDGEPLISLENFLQSNGSPFGLPDAKPDPDPNSERLRRRRRGRREHEPTFKRDWGASLGATKFSNLTSNNSTPVYPAKYSFNVNAPPSCANDYVVFPTGNNSQTSNNPLNPNGQAAIVGFNNLYSTQPATGGYCDADGPTVAWAYVNAACPATMSNDAILSSPTLSLDGTKIAWVTAKGNVQILTLASGAKRGTALAPVCIGAVVSGGDGSSLQSLQLGDAKQNPTNVSLSQVYVDYHSDSAYVGDDNGFLHKITPFFTASGALQEVTTPAWQVSHFYSLGSLVVDKNGFIEECTTAGISGSGGGGPGWTTTWGATTTDNTVVWKNLGSGGGWPVYVTGVSTHTDNSELTVPIFDNVSKNLFVGDQHGSLYYVLDPPTSTAVGSCANGLSLYPCLGLPGTTSGIATGGGPQMDCSTASPGPTCMVMSNQQGFTDSAIVDSTNGLVITQFSNADNTSATVEQTNTSLSVFHSATLAAKSGLSYYIGTFDNAYYSSPASGYYYVCSSDSTGHMTDLYRVGFTDTSGTVALGTVNGTPLQITTANNSGNCSPLAEIYNTATSTDWLFLSVDNHGVTSTCNNASCAMSFTLGSSMVSAVNASYVPCNVLVLGVCVMPGNMNGTGGIIVDNVANTTTYPQASSIYFAPIASNLTCGDGTTNTGCAIKLTQSGLK